jgi:dsDNA-specific endonuclease/ATPase MutS2
VGDKFPILRLLQEKEAKLLDRGAKEMDRDLMGIQNEIENVERQIQEGLVYRIMSVSGIIDEGMDILARLDVLFAKAAFGLKLNGVVPKVSDEGRIDVEKFVHPVLAVRDDPAYSSSGEEPAGLVVPTDLHLSSEEGDRALIISGPNGGGKTLAMKSFGMVCILCRMGIPIPVLGSEKTPRVDYFDRILVEVGDQQSVQEGESTWTAKLNACASIIQSVSSENPDSSKKGSACLVLLDELGSGTDPEAGGAIAQAILEQLMSVHSCRIVATTHSPRLKALSYESSDFGCATVLLKMDSSSEYRLPTFQLEYGSIGDSYAMGAASRCKPKLPEAVLSRAGELMAEEGSEAGTANGGYIRALTDSMEKQVDKAREARTTAEVSAHDSAKCRLAMMSLAAAYDIHLAMLEQRLESCYQSLKDQELDHLELVGETIAELRVVKKQMQSEKERLSERGLRLLPNSYKLAVGESVVIVAEGEWDGTTAKIVADSPQDGTLKPTEVLVQPSGSFSPLDDLLPAAYSPMLEKPIVFLRHELAIWDYDSVWDYKTTETRTTSVLDSKRKLGSLLSTLKTLPTNKTEAKPCPQQSFTSSRGRKSAGKQKKKRK